jgi:hypothetical protein
MPIPNYLTVINQINSFIIANGNNEITANVLNPILRLIADFSNSSIGNLENLTTTENNSVVDSINSLKIDLENINNNGVQLFTGYNNPNDVPPPYYNYADFYMELEPFDESPYQLWQWTGVEWTTYSEVYSKAEIDFIISNISTGAGGGGVIEKTYAELQDLVADSLLIKGQVYLLTDYMTTYIQPITNILKSSDVIEPLYLTAVNNSEFRNICYSALYKQDIVYYTFNGLTRDNNNTEGFSKGKIYRRIDTDKNNDIGTDWRHIRYERAGYQKLFFSNGDNGCYDNVIKTYKLFNSVALGVFSGNTIGNNFNDNTIGDNIFNNTIGNDFKNNTIIGNFTSNTIGDYCYDNTISAAFQHNKIGDTFTVNTIIGTFYSNTIGDSFIGNTIEYNFSNNTIEYDFRINTIGDNFQYNKICTSFTGNTIGTYLQYNTIADGFQGNTIGNDFYDNTIGASFTDNTIGDSFFGNTIGYRFTRNNIFNEFYNNEISSFFTDNFVDEFGYNKIDSFFQGNSFINSVGQNSLIVNTLPNSTFGQRFYVTDALNPIYLDVVVGGGSTICPVFFNGTNWVVS